MWIWSKSLAVCAHRENPEMNELDRILDLDNQVFYHPIPHHKVTVSGRRSDEVILRTMLDPLPYTHSNFERSVKMLYSFVYLFFAKTICRVPKPLKTYQVYVFHDA